jgi:hypothetical protein
VLNECNRMLKYNIFELGITQERERIIAINVENPAG